jgi:hypothetical protein
VKRINFFLIWDLFCIKNYCDLEAKGDAMKEMNRRPRRSSSLKSTTEKSTTRRTRATSNAKRVDYQEYYKDDQEEEEEEEPVFLSLDPPTRRKRKPALMNDKTLNESATEDVAAAKTSSGGLTFEHFKNQDVDLELNAESVPEAEDDSGLGDSVLFSGSSGTATTVPSSLHSSPYPAMNEEDKWQSLIKEGEEEMNSLKRKKASMEEENTQEVVALQSLGQAQAQQPVVKKRGRGRPRRLHANGASPSGPAGSTKKSAGNNATDSAAGTGGPSWYYSKPPPLPLPSSDHVPVDLHEAKERVSRLYRLLDSRYLSLVEGSPGLAERIKHCQQLCHSFDSL